MKIKYKKDRERQTSKGTDNKGKLMLSLLHA